MIAFLRGKIGRLSPLKVTLDVNGVGYELNITLDDSEKLAQTDKGQNVTLFTRVHYTENSQALFGFLNEHMVGLYDFLISLHGIGPKMVMNILSYCDMSELLLSLEKGDAALLTRVPGIGKSKSEKIIFESKSKQKKLETIKSLIRNETGSLAALKNDFLSDLLIESLESLGFNRKEIVLAEKKINQLENNLPAFTQENMQRWIRLYLKYL